MSKKINELKLVSPSAGDSYVSMHEEDIKVVRERLSETMREFQKVIGRMLWDLHQLHRRHDEWLQPGQNLFNELAKIVQMSPSYVRDLIKIADMLILNQKNHLIEYVPIKTLRLVAYKEESVRDELLKKIDEEFWDEQTIKEQANLMQPDSRKSIKTAKFPLKEVKENRHGRSNLGQEELFWFRLSLSSYTEDLLEAKRLLSEFINELESRDEFNTENK